MRWECMLADSYFFSFRETKGWIEQSRSSKVTVSRRIREAAELASYVENVAEGGVGMFHAHNLGLLL